MVSTQRRMIGSVGRWVRDLFASRPLLVFSLLASVLLTDKVMAGESRVALVIGNKDYKVGALNNALNDSRAMRDQLTKLGFTKIVYRENLRFQEIGSTLQEFRSKLEPGAVAFFYYSGHGSQLRGINYLHSVNDESHNEFDLRQYNLTANQVLEVMVEAKARVNVVMLDACRDNPFKSFGRSSDGGLARMIGPAGTVISFATHPGAIAKDDGPDGHGLYTSFLLKYLNSSPDLEIERIFKLVSKEVFRYSKGDQLPWLEGAMVGEDFCFGVCRSNAPETPPATQISADAISDPNVPQPRPVAATATGPKTPPKAGESKPQPRRSDATPTTLAPAAQPAPQVVEPKLQAQSSSASPRQQAPANSALEADVEGCKQKVFAACERAAKAGNASAQGNLGWHYISGESVTKNLESGAYWYRMAAEQGDIYSQKTLAHLYHLGIGVPLDHSQEFYWYKMAAERGDFEAHLKLAEHYSPDKNHGIYWLKRAIDQGYGEGMYHLARLYEKGRLDGLDPEQAKYWDARCMEEVPFCQLKEAWRLIDVGWLSVERKQGLELLEKIASRGYGPAQLDLGRLYAKGKYVDRDEARAVQWLRKALEQGEVAAQAELKKLGY